MFKDFLRVESTMMVVKGQGMSLWRRFAWLVALWRNTAAGVWNFQVGRYDVCNGSGSCDGEAVGVVKDFVIRG